MRQVFNQYPWIPPEEQEVVRKLYYKYGRLQRVKKNKILKCGGECNKLFYLKKGLCMYMVNYDQDKPRALAIIPPGRAMGDLTCLSGEIVNVTTVVKRDSEVLIIPPDILTKCMKQDFDVSQAIIKTTIAKQECFLEGMIANFTLDYEDRLRTLFKSLIISFQCPIEDFTKVPLALNNTELGDIINSTRVTVSRILTKWQREGLARKEEKQLYLSQKLFNDLYDWQDYFK